MVALSGGAGVARSEFDLIYRYLASFGAGEHVRLGVGDDAAVLTIPAGHELLVSTDTLVEGQHFLLDTLPEHIATRAVSTAASDLAAMAAMPLAMTLALTLPESDELWLHSFSMGLARVVQALRLPLIGGDLTCGPLAVTVTVMGCAPNGCWLSRSGASPGDRLCVTGTVGDAAAALASLQGRLPEVDLSCDEVDYLESRFFQPTVQFEYGEWLRLHAHAAIDISDGLLADVGHLASASGLACHIETSLLPLSAVLKQLPDDLAKHWALTGGDDYELAVAVPPESQLPPGFSEVGVFTDGEGVYCSGYDGEVAGFDHFFSAHPENSS